jgi:response regulator NasT
LELLQRLWEIGPAHPATLSIGAFGVNPIGSIAITGQVRGDLVEQAAGLGVFAYLVKPFEEHALEAAITVAFAQYSRIKLLQDEVGSLNEALEARKLVEKAKGILMDRFGLSEGDAMRRL